MKDDFPIGILIIALFPLCFILGVILELLGLIP